MAQGRKIRTPKNRAAFIAALREGWSIAGACNAAGFGTSAAYDWRHDDSEFAAEWDAAVDEGTDRLEDEARRRAMDTSDTLLIFLLKGRRPEKFKDRMQQEHTGTNGGPIEIRTITAKLPEDL